MQRSSACKGVASTQNGTRVHSTTCESQIAPPGRAMRWVWCTLRRGYALTGTLRTKSRIAQPCPLPANRRYWTGPRRPYSADGGAVSWPRGWCEATRRRVDWKPRRWVLWRGRPGLGSGRVGLGPPFVRSGRFDSHLNGEGAGDGALGGDEEVSAAAAGVHRAGVARLVERQ